MIENGNSKCHPILITKISADEAKQIYRNHIKRDFPRNEIRPFRMIQKMLAQNRYEIYSASMDGRFVGYAFLGSIVNQNGKKLILLDYFAVVPEARGKRVGTDFFRKLVSMMDSDTCLLIECESLIEGLDAEALRIRKKRILFYESCGAIHTDVVTSVFGVQYDILIAVSAETSFHMEEALAFTSAVYQDMYPSKLFPVTVRRNSNRCLQ